MQDMTQKLPCPAEHACPHVCGTFPCHAGVGCLLGVCPGAGGAGEGCRDLYK